MNIHDSGYKYLFSNRTFFRQLLETFVDEAWVREADFERAETIDKSFIADHYKTTESDLIYKVPLRDSAVYVYILMEFQSTVDRFMALRVLHYLSAFYMDLVKAGDTPGKLPPVFPIVLYNGEALWTAPTRLEALIEQPELLGRFGVHFEYFKIAENEFSLEELRRIRNLVSMLFMAESHYDLEALAGELLSLFDHEPDHQAISLLMNWFVVLTDKQRIDEEDMTTLQRIYTDREEVRSMLLNTIAREKRQMYEEGKEQGLREGKEEEKRQMARAMLLRGIDIRDIAEITGLSEKDILLLADGTDSDD